MSITNRFDVFDKLYNEPLEEPLKSTHGNVLTSKKVIQEDNLTLAVVLNPELSDITTTEA